MLISLPYKRDRLFHDRQQCSRSVTRSLLYRLLSGRRRCAVISTCSASASERASIATNRSGRRGGRLPANGRLGAAQNKGERVSECEWMDRMCGVWTVRWWTQNPLYSFRKWLMWIEKRTQRSLKMYLLMQSNCNCYYSELLLLDFSVSKQHTVYCSLSSSVVQDYKLKKC